MSLLLFTSNEMAKRYHTETAYKQKNSTFNNYSGKNCSLLYQDNWHTLNCNSVDTRELVNTINSLPFHTAFNSNLTLSSNKSLETVFMSDVTRKSHWNKSIMLVLLCILWNSFSLLQCGKWLKRPVYMDTGVCLQFLFCGTHAYYVNISETGIQC